MAQHVGGGLPGESRGYCKYCDTHDVKSVKMPYAFKLMLQELMAMNLAPRLRIQKKGSVRAQKKTRRVPSRVEASQAGPLFGGGGRGQRDVALGAHGDPGLG